MSAPSILELEPAVTACCDDEAWRPIPNWPTHEASDQGQIRRVPWLDADGCLHFGGVLARRLDKRKGKGYLYVTLVDGQRRRKAAVAVLVLEAWRGLRPAGCEACHNNGVRTDNRLSELRWDTREANRADRARHELERAVTTAASRYGPQVRGTGAAPAVVTATRYGDAGRGTGSLPIPFTFPSLFPSLKPVPSPVSILRSLRSRQAA